MTTNMPPFILLARGFKVGFRALALAFLVAATGAAHAAGQGHLGFSVTIDGEGVFWNPTLKTVTVAKVSPGSPAEKAGLVSGDAIVEVEGRPVAGTKANDLKPFLQREVGQSVRFVVKKASGEVKTVAMVVAPKPE